MEQLGVPAPTMRKRVEEMLDLLGIAALRRRSLRTLSGGEQQRVAIAATLAAHPQALVLDEPTSALDPTGAEEVLAAVSRLVHDLGTTVLMAEHRLERVVQHADTAVWMPGDGSVAHGPVGDVLAGATIAPPVVELARLLGWSPVPLTVRDARRHATTLRERLAVISAPQRSAASPGPIVLRARGLVVRHGGEHAVREVDVDLAAGEVVALMGRNGSGKSSLLWALQGSGPLAAGRVEVQGHDPRRVGAAEARRLVALVPQTAGDLLWLPTVGEELAEADAESSAVAGTARAILERILPGLDPARHPRDLSEGQRLAVALAVQLTAAAPVVLLDEPTRGLDHHAKERFAAVVRELAHEGRAVVVATHDVELVAAMADRVIVLGDGEVVADGPTADVVVSSPTFAPQVAKVLHPDPWLTVAEVAAALGLVAAGDQR
jgi:energy-coupling factor transport system ATP-binding protein